MLIAVDLAEREFSLLNNVLIPSGIRVCSLLRLLSLLNAWFQDWMNEWLFISGINDEFIFVQTFACFVHPPTTQRAINNEICFDGLKFIFECRCCVFPLSIPISRPFIHLFLHYSVWNIRKSKKLYEKCVGLCCADEYLFYFHFLIWNISNLYTFISKFRICVFIFWGLASCSNNLE